VRSLQRLSAAIDRLNDRIGAAIQWIALVMVIVGAFNAIARYADRYTGFSLSSNAYLELQWHLFSLIFMMGAAYGLNHGYHVRVDVLYARLRPRARASTRSATSRATPLRMSRLGGKLVAMRQLTRGPETTPPLALCVAVSVHPAKTPVPAALRAAFLKKYRRFRWSIRSPQSLPIVRELLE
jgi:hypothetical protein